MQSDQYQLHARIEERHWWFAGRRRIMKELVSLVLPPAKERVVVDVGCGTGANIAALADAYTCVGVDDSEEAVSFARERFCGVEFICAQSVADTASAVSRANAVLLMDTLEHVSDDFFFLSQILSSCSPGCFVLITAPADMALWSPHDESFGHYRRYDERRLMLTWQGLPVEPLLVSYFNARLYPVARAVRVFTSLRGKSSGEAGTDFRMPSEPVNRILQFLFSSERHVLTNALRGMRGSGFRRGVSLLALLKRGEGVISHRRKPEGVPPDPYEPVKNDGQPALR